MSVLQLLVYPHPGLRQVCEPISCFDEALVQLQDDLIESMRHYSGCGLAAPQVNIGVRAFVMDTSEKGDSPRFIANPQIIEVEGEEEMEWTEGCLSFPGVYAKTLLAKRVVLKFQDINGQEHVEEFSQDKDALACACVQHESRHLDGILYIDSLSPLKRDRLLKKMAKYLKEASKEVNKET